MAQIEPRAFECTPSSLLASEPCLACISETEMLAILVGILALAVEKNVADVLKDSACYACLSKKEMLQSLVTIAGNDLLGERTTIAAILSATRCVRQCSNKHQLLAALLYLLCNDIKLAERLVLL